MTKTQMTRLVATVCGSSHDRAATALDALFDQWRHALLAGKRLRLDRVGTLSLTPTATRPGHNPKTGARITLAAGARGRFRPAHSLRLAAALIAEDRRQAAE